MPAASSAMNPSAMFADKNCAKRMPFSMPIMCMASTAAAASFIIIGTGVITSVSLFAMALAVSFLLLAILGVLIGLSGLTGLINLVGLTKGLDLDATQGD